MDFYYENFFLPLTKRIQSSQVKRTPQDTINEFTVDPGNSNPLNTLKLEPAANSKQFIISIQIIFYII